MHCAALLFTQKVRNDPTTLDGVYDQITAPSFPATVPELTIWARIFYEVEEVGRHEVGLTIRDMINGEQIGASSGPFQLPARPERAHPSNDVTFNITEARIPHAGEFEFCLAIDGQSLASVWLTVVGAGALN